MRIAVFTFFCNGNYGSELQAIAMDSACKKLGHKLVFYKIKSSNKLERIFEVLEERVDIAFHRLVSKEYRQYYASRRLNTSKQRVISSELKRKVIDSTKAVIETATVPKRSYNKIKGADCYICGSDQVWSALKMPIHKENFLAGIHPNRKIAYAPSFGLNKLPSYFVRTAMKHISSFQYLSVRELAAKEEIKKHTGKDAELVLDPTLMVGKDFWERELSKRNLNKPFSESYNLCYFLGEISDDVVNSINEHYPNRLIICLPYESECTRFPKGRYVEADQFEFVNLIKNAEMVFTDSFHGTVFSILFNTAFVVISRSHEKNVTQTSRIESILSLYGLTQRFCHSKNEIERAMGLQIVFDDVNKKMTSHQDSSRHFLENALNEIETRLK